MEANDNLKLFGDLAPGDIFTIPDYGDVYIVTNFYGEFMENAVNLLNGDGFEFGDNDEICFKGNFSKLIDN